MIKVRIKDLDEIVEWYVKMVLPFIKKRKIKSCSSSHIVTLMVKSLNDDFFCEKVLKLPLEDFVKQNGWVKDYIKLIDFVEFLPKLNKSLMSYKGKVNKIKRVSILTDYIRLFECKALDDLIIGFANTNGNIENGIIMLTASKSTFNRFVGLVKSRVKGLNEIIEQKFNYKILQDNPEIRVQLVKKIGIRVCPYCNRQFINSITIDKRTIITYRSSGH